MPELRAVSAIADLRAQLAEWRGHGARIGFVPTMGALHAGHLSLIAAARARADYVVVSIFVNPTQFAPDEDFMAYPRTFEADFRKLEAARADLVFRPETTELYPPGFATSVIVGGPARVGLEDKFRPSHFEGVATVVAKLLLLVRPQAAVFGEKDYQQLAVVRRLAADLDLECEIVGAPILREPDGLAMSSRNAYLTVDERARAPNLRHALDETATRIAKGEPIAMALQNGRKLLADAGFALDYLELRNALTLQAPQKNAPLQLLAAARLGRTRLIDNVAVEAPPNAEMQP